VARVGYSLLSGPLARRRKEKQDELDRRLSYLRLMSDTLSSLIFWNDKTVADLDELMKDPEFAIQARKTVGGKMEFQDKLPEGARLFIEFIKREFPQK